MKGRTVVITGGTSGIGQVAAETLAGMGARIVSVARDKARGDATMARLRAKGPAAEHAIHYAELSRIAEMKRVAHEISASEPRIDVLINNAGAMFNRREVTEDGLELTFATNHVAYFVLTQLLRDKLPASGRIVSTSSHAHKGAKLNFDDLQATHGYSGFRVYGRSKLCNILFTRELARQLAGTGVTANCLHPGFVATRFGDQSGGFGSKVFQLFKTFAISPEKGAETIVYLASSETPAAVGGAYFYKCREATPSAEAQDDQAARRLWRETAKLTGL
jgi:NAD(P)-dependent dehydrogenase (short-subunit alcohol dehydrogenase family)